VEQSFDVTKDLFNKTTDGESASLPMKHLGRIQLNAAIQRLIESKGFSDEARQTVYEFGVSLAAVSRVSGSVKMETPGDSVTGYTQEQGSVQIHEDKEQVRKVEFGAERARIGAYKIWREKTKRGKFRFTIAHFWKLDQGTESMDEMPEAWCLECDQNGPVWFGERATRTIFQHFGLCLKRHLFVESWGGNAGKHHRAGLAIYLSL
jgi:hypothetical protein